MKLIKIELPRIYKFKEGETNPLYKKYNNWNKISYSQIGSFKDYRMGYLRDYILGLKEEDSGIFATYGSACGKYFEDSTRGEFLSNSDVEIIDKIKKYPTSKYESEIVIDLEPFGIEKTCLQGFSDHEWNEGMLLNIDDLKTGNSDNMLFKYSDMNKYYQTRVYAYQREKEGFEINNCQVIHLGRKGNNLIQGDKNVLRLTGQIDYILTPYKKEDVEKYLKETVVKTCIEISEIKNVHDKYFL